MYAEVRVLQFETFQVAAKLEGGGSKRPLEEGNEPSAKKVAPSDQGYLQTPMGYVFFFTL